MISARYSPTGTTEILHMRANESDIRILFVDDEPEVLKSISRILIQEPYQKVFAQSGSEALDILAMDSVDIIIADLRMPEMDGLSLLEAVRGQYPDVIRLVLSADTEVNTLFDAINLGQVFRYISKPIRELGAFKETLNQAVAHSLTYRQAREADRMKSEFVASVSHELRTPLASIQGFTSTILRDPEMDKETRHEFLEIIDRECARLSLLIEGILDLRMIESGAEQLHLSTIDFVALVREAANALQHMSDTANVLIKLKLPEAGPVITADQDRAFRLIYNLVDNAIKFTPADGQVNIDVSVKPSTICLRIRDTGIGIAPASLPHICERFYRERHDGRETPGTGIGLALVKQTVQLHGWVIDFESSEGNGTTVTLRIPCPPDSSMYPENGDQAEAGDQ